jgi:ATP-dependent Clp protease protease subunit
LLAGGTKGKRMALPNAEIMIHQPMGGMPSGSQASDMEITTKHILRTKRKINEILADATGKPVEMLEKDTDRDNWLSAQEALDYGLIDSIISNRE